MKEATGIYNITFNNKRATPIQMDIKLIEDAVIAEITMYVRGFQENRRKKDVGMGAKHIKLHLDLQSKGHINVEELLNLGKSIREYIRLFKEPLIDERGAKIYEWENQNGVRFRTIVDKAPKLILQNQIKQVGGPQLPLAQLVNVIITFYSDRNLNERMQFKNAEVSKHYENKQQNLQQNKPTQTQLDSKIQTPKPQKFHKHKRR